MCAFMLLLVGCTMSLAERPTILVEDLSQYPHWFFDEGNFNGVVIVDSNAQKEDKENALIMIEHLRQYDSSMDESLLKEYPAYSNLGKDNAILIGSCSQEPTNRFANLYLDCVSMLEDQALIRIVHHQGAWLLFIVGYDPERTYDAITMLMDYESYPLSGAGVEVVRESETFRVGLPR